MGEDRLLVHEGVVVERLCRGLRLRLRDVRRFGDLSRQRQLTGNLIRNLACLRLHLLEGLYAGKQVPSIYFKLSKLT